jgi:hypothetical protein
MAGDTVFQRSNPQPTTINSMAWTYLVLAGLQDRAK